jgi:hypothetical protein
VPSVRFSRDKRGYEYVYLVHTPVRRGKPGRTRVLYWYRTPPGIRIGRKPFDEEVQRTLEQQNPGLTFDWEAIIATPMPPPDMTEFWRERRRAEKLARQERRSGEGEKMSTAAGTVDTDAEALSDGEPALSGDSGSDESGPTDVAESFEVAEEGSAAEPSIASAAGRKRRRRRGGRRRPSPEGSGPSEPAPAASEGVPSSDSDDREID